MLMQRVDRMHRIQVLTYLNLWSQKALIAALIRGFELPRVLNKNITVFFGRKYAYLN
jgi:hypothetical protein